MEFSIVGGLRGPRTERTPSQVIRFVNTCTRLLPWTSDAQRQYVCHFGIEWCGLAV